MQRLVYSCYAQRDITDDDLQQIAESSSRRNADWEISGALLYSKRRFIQILEGSKHRLFDLIDIVLRDPRAGAIKIEAIEPCSERVFEGWGMHVAPVSVQCPGRERLLGELTQLFHARPGDVAGSIELASCLSELRTLIEQQGTSWPIESS